jgi:hypothetical protein
MKDGTFELSQPWTAETELPLIDIRDTGKFIVPALLDPDLYHGKRFTCATAFYTLADMVDTWTKVTGITVKLQVSHETADYSKLTEEQKKMLKKAQDPSAQFSYFGPTGQEDLTWTHQQVTDKLRGWEEFLQDNEPWFSS